MSRLGGAYMEGNSGGVGVVESRIDKLERWAERHEDSQAKSTQRIFERLDELTHSLSQRLPPWGSALVALLAALVGLLGGALFM